ncbi:MAG: XRE family transcriptional regulator, partial [uncultured bacterium]
MTDPLGQDIRALRKTRGQTLQQLADAVGRSVGWLSQIERGQTTPSIADLGRIAEVLGVTISFFFRSASRSA